MGFKSTREVARLLGVSTSRLARAVWDQRVSSPAKGPGSAFLWDARNIEQASWYFRHRDASDILPAGGQSAQEAGQ